MTSRKVATLSSTEIDDRNDFTLDDIPHNVVIQDALHRHLGGNWEDWEAPADAVFAAIYDEYRRVIVRADDLDAYLNRTGLGENILREVDALNRLLAAIQPENTEDTSNV